MRTNFYPRAEQLPAWLMVAASGLLAKPALAQTPTFAPMATYATGAGTFPYRVAVADVNGDGKPDAITSLQQQGQIGVQLGNGDGTFRAVATYASGDPTVYNQTIGVAVADVNADGRPDVLVVNRSFATGVSVGSVGVLLGNGDGSFQKVVPYLVGPAGTDTYPRELVVTDVDRDGRPDVVVSDEVSGVVALLGNGNGIFQAPVTYSTGASGSVLDVAAGDVNFDGLPDIAASCITATNSSSAPYYTYSVRLLLSKSGGGFQPVKSISTTSSGRIRIAEVLGGINGGPDIVTSGYVLAGDGTGNFSTVAYPAGTPGGDVAVGDVNGDGFADILTADYSGGQVALLLSNAGNSFQAAGTFATGTDSRPTSLVVTDVSGDGKRDVLTTNAGTNTLGVLLNTTVLPTKFAYTGSTQTYTVPAGVTRLAVVATGANGGLVGRLNDYAFTYGAQVKATVTVTPGEVLTVVVGGVGTGGGNPSFVPSRSSPAGSVNAGGYNGGGSGFFTGGGGGGATDLRRAAAQGRTDDYLASRNALVVAGGGGGSDRDNNSNNFPGSDGGNPTSYPARYTPANPAGSLSAAGGGASQTAPGGGSNAGTEGNGGNSRYDNTALYSGSGGGGGYYGGGAGTINMGIFANSRTDFVGAGGGGGSSFVSPTGSSDISYSRGSGGPSLTIMPLTPAATTNPDLTVSTTATIPAGTYNTITVTSTGVGTLGGDVTVTGSVTVQSGGTLNDGCATLSGAGSFTLAAGGTLGICNAAGISSSGATGAVQTTGARSFSPDASYVYNGTAAQSTGNGLPSQVRNLSTTNAANVTLTAPTSVVQVLTVGAAGNLVLNGQALTLLSNSAGTALVVNAGTGIVSGNTAVVQRYIDGSLNSGRGYRHFSVPLTGTTLADFTTSSYTPILNSAYNTSSTPATVTPFPTLYIYNQSALASRTNNLSAFDKGWLSPSSLGDNIIPGIGYCVNIEAGQVVDFVGTLYNSPLTVGMSRTTGATAADGGWQLIGNPYPAPLDLSRVQDADRSNLDAATYVVQSTGPYAGGYRAFVNGMSTSATNNPLLALGQAFFVRVSAGQTNGSFTFRAAQRGTSFANQAAFQRTAADPRPAVRLELAGAGLADGWVAYAETGATPAFDSQLDASKLPNSTGLNLSSVAGADNLAIDGRPAFTAATTIALTVGVPTAGTYTLAAASLANLPAGLDAYLRDAQTGQLTKLAAGSSYAFSVSSAEAQALLVGRFTLQFNTASPLSTSAALTAATVTVYPNPTRESFAVVVPAVAGASQVQAELHNALGQVVRRQAAALPAAGATFTVPTAALAPGVYVLRLTAGSSTLTQRVVVQ